MQVECYICGTTVAQSRAALVWRHPADGSPPVQVWLCEFCQDLADDEPEESEE